MFLLVPAYPGCPGSKAVKQSLLLLYLAILLKLQLVTNTGHSIYCASIASHGKNSVRKKTVTAKNHNKQDVQQYAHYTKLLVFFQATFE